jgi:uncharacterized protein (TIGR02996 family)
MDQGSSMDPGGSMDVEGFAREWRRARRRWERLNAEKQGRNAAGTQLAPDFLVSWQVAKTEFEAAEAEWDQACRDGVVIAVGDAGADRAEARLDEMYEQVLSAPLDDAPRLAYADAVEAADPERAEFIRIQVRLASRRRLRWYPSQPTGEYNLEHMLIRTRGTEWAGGLRRLIGSWQYLRGFADVIRTDAPAFLARAPEMYRRAPVLHLDLTDVRPVVAELFASPYLRRIRSISMLHQQLGDEAAIAIASSPHLARMEWLQLSNNRIGAGGLEALVASERLPRLGYLGFAANVAEDPTPRQADEYDADTAAAVEFQRRYGPRDWLSARVRHVWPPARDAVWLADPD